MNRYLPTLAVLLAAVPAHAGETPAQPSVTIMSAAHEVGVIRQGEREVRRTMLLDEASSVTIVLTSPRPYEAEVVLPDGSVLSAETADGERRRWLQVWLDDSRHLSVPGLGQGANTLATIERPQPGPYEVRLRAREESAEPVAFAFTMLPISEVRVGLALPESTSLTGRPVAVSALAYDGDQPLEGCAVRALVSRQPDDPRESLGEPLRIELADRGEDADAKAGDGAFTGTFTPKDEGRYWVAVRVTGKSRGGFEFVRDVGGAVTVTRQTGLLTGHYEATAHDTDDDGRLDRLRVSMGAEVAASGRYDAVVQLRGRDGQTVSAHALLTLEAGSQELAVDFTGSQVRFLGIDGPYVIASVQVDEITENDRVLRDRAYEAGETPAFKLDNFAEDPRP
jgi:hypothetical protein